MITRLYQLWLVLAGTLVVNMVACICILISGSPNGGSDLGSSIGCASVSLARPSSTHGRRLGAGISSLSHHCPSCYGTGTCYFGINRIHALTSVGRPIYNGYMKVCMALTSRTPYPDSLGLRNKHSTTVCFHGIASSPDSCRPIDLYFFFGGFHLLFSVYMYV